MHFLLRRARSWSHCNLFWAREKTSWHISPLMFHVFASHITTICTRGNGLFPSETYIWCLRFLVLMMEQTFASAVSRQNLCGSLRIHAAACWLDEAVRGMSNCCGCKEKSTNRCWKPSPSSFLYLPELFNIFTPTVLALSQVVNPLTEIAFWFISKDT